MPGGSVAGTYDFGYVHVWARYYDPAVGRFLQRDPIGLFGGFNVYAYCANNPVSHVDPTGRLSFVDVVKTGGWQAALVGGAANSAKYALTQLLSSQRISPGVLVALHRRGAECGWRLHWCRGRTDNWRAGCQCGEWNRWASPGNCARRLRVAPVDFRTNRHRRWVRRRKSWRSE
ncbi:MAG: RHS repeat-associated core domain-containing protein [Phycisphaerales bacterium]|nr:RHS repeat-associated core domain-containing protein [Phycisphaerales bacterium]